MERSTFLYLDSKGTPNDFAQCRSCKMWLEKHNICSLHGKDVKITGDMSCGLYSFGGPAPESEMEHVTKAVTPEQSGLVKAEVRCENCKWFDADESECRLFCMLNISPDKVNPKGCCNAWESEEKTEDTKKLKRTDAGAKTLLKKKETKNPFEE